MVTMLTYNNAAVLPVALKAMKMVIQRQQENANESSSCLQFQAEWQRESVRSVAVPRNQ